MFRHGVALVSILLLLASGVLAQTKTDQPKPDAAKAKLAAAAPAKPPGAKPEAKKAVEAATPAPAPAASKLPDNFKINMMIRSIVIAVNQANKTNNYTVLRDLGSPDFRVGNSAEKLALVFEQLRKSKFDLSPVLFFTPKLLQPPALTDDGMLRLRGFFDTRPQIVAFDLLYQDVDGEWQLFGISLSTRPVPAESAKETAPPVQESKKDAAKSPSAKEALPATKTPSEAKTPPSQKGSASNPAENNKK